MHGARVRLSMKIGRIAALAHNQERQWAPLIAGSAQDRLIGKTEYCRFFNLARIAKVHHETFVLASSKPNLEARQGQRKPDSDERITDKAVTNTISRMGKVCVVATQEASES